MLEQPSVIIGFSKLWNGKVLYTDYLLRPTCQHLQDTKIWNCICTLFNKTQEPENDTLDRTSLYIANIWEYPFPQGDIPTTEPVWCRCPIANTHSSAQQCEAMSISSWIAGNAIHRCMPSLKDKFKLTPVGDTSERVSVSSWYQHHDWKDEHWLGSTIQYFIPGWIFYHTPHLDLDMENSENGRFENCNSEFFFDRACPKTPLARSTY